MKLVMLFGDGAVGKMTVGQALCAKTPLRLLHNHMTIEPVLEVFGRFDTHTILRLRRVLYEEFAASDLYGLVTTFMWAFDEEEDWKLSYEIAGIFEAQGADVYWVELVADKEVRLARNVTENRLKHKASKRDIEASTKRLLADDDKHRFESRPGEIPFADYIRIDNTHLSPDEVAERIITRFNLARNDGVQ